MSCVTSTVHDRSCMYKVDVNNYSQICGTLYQVERTAPEVILDIQGLALFLGLLRDYIFSF